MVLVTGWLYSDFTFKTGPDPRPPELVRELGSVKVVMSVVTSEAGHSPEVNTVRPPHGVEAVTRLEAGALSLAECLHWGRVAETLVRLQLEPPCVMQPELSWPRLWRIPRSAHPNLPVMRIRPEELLAASAHSVITCDSWGHREAAELVTVSLCEARSVGAEVSKSSVILGVIVWVKSSPTTRNGPEYHRGKTFRRGFPVHILHSPLHNSYLKRDITSLDKQASRFPSPDHPHWSLVAWLSLIRVLCWWCLSMSWWQEPSLCTWLRARRLFTAGERLVNDRKL